MGGECCVCGEMRYAYGVSLVNLNERVHLEDLGASGRIILKWILENETGCAWLRIHDNESRSSVKYREYLDLIFLLLATKERLSFLQLVGYVCGIINTNEGKVALPDFIGKLPQKDLEVDERVIRK